MSIQINIKGTLIDFPSSGESPNWSPAVIEFAQAVEDAILSAVGPYDIPSQVFTILNDNQTYDVTNLSFSTATVRAGFIRYSIILEGTATTTEAGNIMVVYNGSTWDLTRDYVGNANCIFSISSIGQVSVIIPAVPGFVTGKLSFSAQALKQNA
jgi:hypothetical protein